MQVYTGKNPAVRREINEGASVVKDFFKKIEHSERNITCDGDLLKKTLTLVGAIRKNRHSFTSDTASQRLTDHPLHWTQY